VSKEESGSVALSAREIQIVRLIAQGKTNDEIAAELSLSPRTVHSHIASAFKKVDVSNRTQLAVYALTNGLLEDDPSE
jgi:DNA-binding NarL/FixJ family response regulator